MNVINVFNVSFWMCLIRSSAKGGGNTVFLPVHIEHVYFVAIVKRLHDAGGGGG
jgi:hypothetical protein